MNLDEARTSTAAALTVTQVAALLEVDVRTVSRACEDGQLPSLRIGRRLLIPRLPLLSLLGAAPDDSEAGAPTPAIATAPQPQPGDDRETTPRGPLGLAG